MLTVARSRLQHEVQDEVPPPDVFLSDPFSRDSKYNLDILSIVLKVLTEAVLPPAFSQNCSSSESDSGEVSTSRSSSSESDSGEVGESFIRSIIS